MKGNGRLEARVAQHDREIAAIRKLVLQGMKMLSAIAEEQRLFRSEMRLLQGSQRKTDTQLQALIRSLRQGGNGRVEG